MVADSLGDQEFDLVLVCYLQIPPLSRRVALQSSARAVAEGGTLIVIAHHSDNLHDGVGGPQNPELLYSEQDVLDDLAETDWLIVRAERATRAVVVNGDERIALDTVVVLRRPKPER